MPLVSIVMPTFNRADTIGRAIESVREQAWSDWELLVVDDGSTDGTRDRIAGIDPRVRVIVQENQGVAVARNTALAAARGDLVAFLDSDDAWTPHHLALAVAFFEAFPDEHVFAGELWEDFGGRELVKHFRVETGTWYPDTARRIGSSAFSRPPPEGDPYLWFYETRTPVGPWARRALEGTPYRDAFHYRGRIFEGLRWGWLLSLIPTVITRRAKEAVGPNDTSYRIASDFGYVASLCRQFPVNLVSAPGSVKHEYATGKQPLKQGHLVTGGTAIRFHQDVLRYHEELFWKRAPEDPELTALRGFRQYLVAAAAARAGQPEVAKRYADEAIRAYPGPDVSAVRWLAQLVPSPTLSAGLYRAATRAGRLPAKVRRVMGRLAPSR